MSPTNDRPGAVRPPLPVAAAAFVSSFDRFAVGPLLILVSVDLGVSLAQALAIASTYYFAYGVSQPLWGMLSDRFGRLRLMRFTLLGAALTGIASAAAPGLTTLIIARALTGALYGAVIPASLTHVGDTVAEERRQPALADLMVAVACGTALATALAGVIGDSAGWRVVFAAPVLVSVVCAVALGRLTEPPREAPAGLLRTASRVLRDRWVLAVLLLAFVVLTLLAPALQSQGTGAGAAGAATAAYGVGVILTSRLVRPLSRHLSMPGLMGLGGAAAVVGYAVVAVHTSVWTVVAVALLLGATWSFLHSSLQTWATSVVPEARGTVVSLFAGFLFAGSAVGAAVGGPLGDAQQWALLFGSTAVVALLVTGAAVLARLRYERPGARD
jgi:predicted MFS family arabinose efflux permease